MKESNRESRKFVIRQDARVGRRRRTKAARKSPRSASRAFAVEALTDLVFIELPKVGRQVKAGESFCEVESVKAVSDVYAPVAGEVIAVNESLADNLETLSNDPYGEGWIARIKITDDAGLKNLMDHAAYQKQCAEEAH